MIKKLFVSISAFLYSSYLFAQSQYLEAPPVDIGKDVSVGKSMGLINWLISLGVGLFVLWCGVEGSNHVRKKEFGLAAGPFIAAIVTAIASAWALNK